MDNEFIQNALRITSFNLSAKDFESLKHKKEIQYLFGVHFFPKFDLSKTIKDIDKNKLNKLITELKSIDKVMFTKLHKYNLKGVGPGEVTLYFLVDDAHLGGGSSAGVDLIVGSNKYEIKSVDITGDGKYAKNFKVGGTFSLSSVVTGIQKLAKEAKLTTGSEISVVKIRTLREKYPLEFGRLEEEYKDLTYNNYFKAHDIIFMRNSTSKIGDIAAIKRVKKEDIIIESVTSGTIKPFVKI